MILPAIRRYLGEFDSLNGGLQAAQSDPDEPTMAFLAMCSDALSGRHNEPYPSTFDVDSVRRELQDVRQAIREADLDLDLQSFLLAQLHNLEAALDEFLISGIDAARKAFARLVGEMAMHSPRAAADAETRNVRERFLTLLNHYAGLFNVCVMGTAIAQTVNAALPAAPHH